MGDIKDFFQEFKERLTSPIFGSFIIAWLVINWEIPLTLIAYNQDELKLDGNVSYLQFVKDRYSFLNCFIFPLVASLVYILCYPHLKNIVNRYIAKAKIKGDAELLKISKDNGYVSIEKHLSIKSQLDNKMEQLTNFYAEQTQIEKQYSELQDTHSLLLEENERQKIEIDKLGKRVPEKQTVEKFLDVYEVISKYSFFGNFDAKIMDVYNNLIGVYTISISAETVYFQLTAKSTGSESPMHHLLSYGTFKVFTFSILQGGQLQITLSNENYHNSGFYTYPLIVGIYYSYLLCI